MMTTTTPRKMLELTIREESVLYLAVVNRMHELQERIDILKTAAHTVALQSMKDDLEVLREIKNKLI